MNNWILIFLLTSCLFACSFSDNKAVNTAENSVPQKLTINKIEKLYSLKVMDTAVEISVISTGCTSASDFEIFSDHSGNSCAVKILRVHPDLCKRAPSEIKLELLLNKFDDCEQSEIKVVNEVVKAGAI